MLKQFQLLMFTAAVLLLSACGFGFNNSGLIPSALQKLTLESQDPYSETTVLLRKALRQRNVNLVAAAEGVPVLRLNSVQQSEQLASILKQGKEAEKILVLAVEASVKLPNQISFPISTKVHRTFFDNARAALAKSAEKEVIWQDMHEQAVRQLIAKLAILQPKMTALSPTMKP